VDASKDDAEQTLSVYQETWIAMEVPTGFIDEECQFFIAFDLLIFADTTEQRDSEVTRLPHRSQQGRFGTDLHSVTWKLEPRSQPLTGFLVDQHGSSTFLSLIFDFLQTAWKNERALQKGHNAGRHRNRHRNRAEIPWRFQQARQQRNLLNGMENLKYN
jgi:hypothetical protein